MVGVTEMIDVLLQVCVVLEEAKQVSPIAYSHVTDFYNVK